MAAKNANHCAIGAHSEVDIRVLIKGGALHPNQFHSLHPYHHPGVDSGCAAGWRSRLHFWPAPKDSRVQILTSCETFFAGFARSGNELPVLGVTIPRIRPGLIEYNMSVFRHEWLKTKEYGSCGGGWRERESMGYSSEEE